jgi:ABC-type transport system involved in cytochrome bd biosynthesis fused ATPase/permease subunit
MNFNVKQRFEGFLFFYRYIGNRIILALALSIVVGVLDGFGLTMFLPLLQVVESGETINGAELGGLQFLITAIQKLNISLNLMSVLAFIVIFFILKSGVAFFQYYYRVSLQEFFIRKIRISNIEGLNSISYKAFLQADSGRIQNTLSGEVDRVSRAYQGYFQAVQCIIMVLVYFMFAFFVNAEFAILVSAGGLLTNLIYKRIYTSTKGASRKLTSETNDFQGLIIH